MPRRGIGDSSIDALQSFASARTQPLLHAILQLNEGDIAKSAWEKFTAFAELLSDVYMQFGIRSFPDVVEYLLEKIGYDAYLQADRKENYEARADIVKEFVGYIREFTESMDETKVDVLSAFLENVALFSATDTMDEVNGRVAMMTLHSAKGLEFPVVFLCGLEDGLFPSMQSIYEPEKTGRGAQALLCRHHTRASETISFSRKTAVIIRQDHARHAFALLDRTGRRAAPEQQARPAARTAKEHAPAAGVRHLRSLR